MQYLPKVFPTIMNSTDNSISEKSSESIKNGEKREKKKKKKMSAADVPGETKEKTTITKKPGANANELMDEEVTKDEHTVILNGKCDGSSESTPVDDNEIKTVKRAPHLSKKRKRKSKEPSVENNGKQSEMSDKLDTSSTSPGKTPEKDCASETIDWLPGDLVWAHMTGYPWWPGLIEDDPIQKIHTRIQGKGRWFHVQFFGVDVVRGWVKSVMKYEGEKRFKEMKENISHISRKSDPRAKRMSWFEVKPSKLSDWQSAVDEAEEALLCEREERRIRFGVEYFDVPPKEKHESLSPGKRKYSRRKGSKTEDAMTKLDTAVDSNSLSTPSSKTVDGTSNTDHSREDLLANEASSDRKASPNRNKKPPPVYRTEGNFKLFLEKHADKTKEENPNLDNEALETFLQEQWEQMSVQQKSRYISRFDSVESSPTVESKNIELSQSPYLENVFRKRAHKPSQRFLEAAVSNLYPSPRSSKKSPKTSPSAEQKNKKDDNSEKEISNAPNKLSKVTEKSTNKISKTTEKLINMELSKSEELRSFVNHLNDDLPAEIAPSESCASVSSLGSNTSSRSSAETRYDKICQVCLNSVVSGSSNFVKCEGVCSSSFHKACLNLTITESTFKCSECTEGIHTCFACKEKSQDTRKCSLNQCGRFYHESCLKKYPAARIDSKNFICSLHTCVSCIPESPWKEHVVHRGRMVRCIRCPTAYHMKDSCLAAGAEILSSSTMVCPSHYDKNQRQRFKQINVNWCFICSSGGSLICCESCPAAFHAECLHIDTPEGNYYCRDCALGRQPKFGDIVWVKLGCYRWWPARILHPKSVPENIQALKHQVGEFPVEFFGSHDYYWTNRSRVFLYQEGDKGNENAGGRALAKSYDKALQEATEAYIQWKAAKETRDDKNRVYQKPPPFRTIKVNKPVGKVQLVPSSPLEGAPCECTPGAENPCGSDSDCLNRMVMFECNAAVCPAGLKCCNQRFQKRQYVETVPFKTTNRGWGLKAKTDITKGLFVVEYVGELIDEEECKKRMEKMHEMDKTDYYFLTLDKDRIIDAGEKGNVARYMNHSCQPNCETQKWTVNGDTRVGLFAICDIPAGTELTFNYYLDCLGNEKRPCNCQSPLCSGFIGERPKVSTNGSVLNDIKKPNETKKRKKQKTVDEKKKVAEDHIEKEVQESEKESRELEKETQESEKECRESEKESRESEKEVQELEKETRESEKEVQESEKETRESDNEIRDNAEDECFYCKDGGELVLCDRQNCPKAYHLRCVKMTDVPEGIWECPWHNCDVCSEPSMLLCSVCPSSFCPVHHAHSITILPGGRVVCRKHVSKKRKLESDSDTDSKDEEIAEPVGKRRPGRPKKSIEPINEETQAEMKEAVPNTSTIDSAEKGRKSDDIQSDDSEKTLEMDLAERNGQEVIKADTINEGLRNIFETFSTVPSTAEKNLVESVSVIKEIEIAEEQEQAAKNENVTLKTKKNMKRKFRSAGWSLRPHRMHRRTRDTHIRRSRSGSIVVPINGQKKKVGRPRKVIIPVEEKISSGSQNGESSSSKEDDETMAIITVETDGMADLGLKPYVQKYRLENGEFSLEEYEDTETGTGNENTENAITAE